MESEHTAKTNRLEEEISTVRAKIENVEQDLKDCLDKKVVLLKKIKADKGHNVIFRTRR